MQLTSFAVKIKSNNKLFILYHFTLNQQLKFINLLFNLEKIMNQYFQLNYNFSNYLKNELKLQIVNNLQLIQI